jgi:hypothetical protein
VRVLPATAALFIAAAVPALAAGAIPVWEPTTISSPGHYVVTRDFTVSGAFGIPITITSPDVVLDLGGHTVTSTVPGAAPAVYIVPGPGGGTIEIRNGHLRGGRGVLYEGDPVASPIRLRFEGLHVAAWAVGGAMEVEGAPVVEVVRCTIQSSDYGIVANEESGLTGLFAENVIEAGFVGLALEALRAGVVRDNVVRANLGIIISGDDGLDPNGNVVIERNLVHGMPSGSVGIQIFLPASLVDNVVTGFDIGIHVSWYSRGARLSGNVIGHTAEIGIWAQADRCTISGNLIESGLVHGIMLDLVRDSLLENNTIQGHFGVGIYSQGTLDGSNVYRGNMLRNNVSGAVAGPALLDAGGNIH